MSVSSSLTKGDIIVSLPSSNPLDAPFSRTVILIADQNSEGSIGFILNKPMDLTLDQLIPSAQASFTVYDGGPVEQDKIFCIHNVPELIHDSQLIQDQLYWGGDYEQIFSLLNQGLIKKENLRFFLGYTGWDYEQLNNELEDNFWIKSNITNPEELFHQNSKDFWKKTIQALGSRYDVWQNAPQNPNFN